MQPQKYKVLGELGVGGMGKVYRGLLIGRSGFQRPIVIKQLKNALEIGHVKLFVDEARRYAVLDHENIGRIFDFEDVDGEMCIILEYIDGWSLIEYVERHRDLGRLPDVDLSVFIVSRVCRALQYVFEKAAIVHRDISPSNIMMTREGTVKLIDFGIATRSGTRDSSLTGKPAYMAPEMVVELRADNRSDIFSLGAVLFEILTLQRLFQGETTAQILEQVVAGHTPSPRAHNPSVGEGVMTIIKTALQRDPAKRYASAGEMGQACEHFLYDKGYGPTNLTLKQYVGTIFPTAEIPSYELEPAHDFPMVEARLLPISRTPTPARRNDSDATPVSPLARLPVDRGAVPVANGGRDDRTMAPDLEAPATLAPGPAGTTRTTGRRLKPRNRAR